MNEIVDRLWLDAPAMALRVRAGAPMQAECNRAADLWGQGHGLRSEDWQGLADRALAEATDVFATTLGPQAQRVQCRRVVLPGGPLLWITPEAPAAPAPAVSFERALALADVSVWRSDLHTQRVQFNAVGYALMGMQALPDGIPIRDVRQAIHPDDLQKVLDAHEQALAGDRIVDAEARYALPQGWRWLLTRRVAERDAHGRAVALAGISIDVTERHAERAEVAARIQQTELVAQVLGVGFWSQDDDATTPTWDAQMYRLYGRSQALSPPTLAEWIDGYVHPGQRDDVRRRLESDLAADAKSTLMTVQLATAGEGDRWVRCWTRRLRRPDGQRFEVGVHLDVTEQRRAEALQTEAERAARLSREKSAFMALMSHQLRTPLNAVLGFTQLLAQDATEPLGQRQRERLARIDSAGQELLAMVDDVFELAQLDVDGKTPSLLPVPASQLVSQVYEAVQPLARQRGVQLRLDDETGAAALATDRRRLGQALVHLMSHGVRTSERGGWVGLQAALLDDRCLITVRLGSGTDDAGEQRELAFDTVAAPLEQGGSGDALIGLDLVRQVLERLGARVEWPSAEGALRLALPLAEPAPTPAIGLKLLCIEDNPVNLMLVRELVAMRPSIQFFSADDGLSGLALAAAHRPDVVLLDLQLPDIPGAEVLARIRMQPELTRCRVIALSANAIPDDIRASREAGFDDYWTKPIDFDRFLAGLDQLASARG